MKMTRWAPAFISTLVLAGCVTSGVDPQADRSSATEAARYNVQLGLEYMRQGRRDIALEKLNRALEQDPRLADAHVAIALVYDQVGEVVLADQHYRRAIRLEPGNPGILNNYGVFLCNQGNLRDAEQNFLHAARNPQYTTPEVAWTNAGICAEKEPDLEKAEGRYRDALRLNPRFGDALWHMARLGYRRENMLQSRAFLQRYLEVAQHSAESAWLGYRIESSLDDREAAAGYAILLRERFTDSAETRLLIEHERGQRR